MSVGSGEGMNEGRPVGTCVGPGEGFEVGG